MDKSDKSIAEKVYDDLRSSLNKMLLRAIGWILSVSIIAVGTIIWRTAVLQAQNDQQIKALEKNVEEVVKDHTYDCANMKEIMKDKASNDLVNGNFEVVKSELNAIKKEVTEIKEDIKYIKNK